MTAARDFRPRFECGNPECGHLSLRHEKIHGGGRCLFPGCKCGRLVAAITAREFEMLQLIAAGGGSKGAAEKLDLSAKTVEVHLANMRAKTGLTSTLDLILAALRMRLISLDDLPATPAAAFTVQGGA